VVDGHPGDPRDATSDDQERKTIPAASRDPTVDQDLLEPPATFPPQRMKAVSGTPVANLDPLTVLEGQRQTGAVRGSLEHPGGDATPGQAKTDVQLLDDQLPRDLKSIRETGSGRGRGGRPHQHQLSGTLFPTESPAAIDADPPAAGSFDAVRAAAGELPHQLPAGSPTGGVGGPGATVEPREGRRQKLR